MTGTVVSRQDGQPVANAAVVVEGTSLTAVTNAAGRFRIENAPPVRSTVVVRAPGFLDGRVTDVLPGSGRGGIDRRARSDAELSRARSGDGNQVAAQRRRCRSSDRHRHSRRPSTWPTSRRLAQAVSHVPGAVITTQLGIFESVLFHGMPRADLEYTNTLLMIDGVPQTSLPTGRGPSPCRFTTPTASRSSAVRTPRCMAARRSAARSTC